MTNTGERAGEETVQLYLSQPVASVTRSVEDLRGFQKVRLQPGETREVTFRITPEDLKFYNGNLEYDWEPGEFIVRIGGNSASQLSRRPCAGARRQMPQRLSKRAIRLQIEAVRTPLEPTTLWCVQRLDCGVE